jgi:hypothetical protein
MKDGQHWRKQKTGRVEEKILTQQAVPQAAKLVKCDACHQNEATIHVTVSIECFTINSTRMKQSQFWLCEGCDAQMKVFLTRDDQQPRRVAKALTPIPFYWVEASGGRGAKSQGTTR